METLIISTCEQRIKCKHCPNRDTCPLLKRQERTRVKLCTWHDYASSEYTSFAAALIKVDTRLGEKHYKLKYNELEKRNAEIMRKIEQQMEEINRQAEQRQKERQLKEHIKAGKPCITFEQVQYRNREFREDFDLKVEIMKPLEEFAYAKYYKFKRDNEEFEYLELTQLRDFWNEHLYTRPN